MKVKEIIDCLKFQDEVNKMMEEIGIKQIIHTLYLLMMMKE